MNFWISNRYTISSRAKYSISGTYIPVLSTVLSIVIYMVLLGNSLPFPGYFAKTRNDLV